MIKHHAYIVNWRDSCTHTGWRSQSESLLVSDITSVGWIVKQDKKSVTISTCIADNGDIRSAVTIPREAITRMHRLPRHASKK